MNARLSRPLPHRLPIIVERNRTETPQHRQAHIQHDRFDKTAFFAPRRDELAKSVAPDVLVHRDGDEQETCDRLIAIDGIG